jgi:prepilin-type N-terminal cleavage/methylation domain-containing protein
MHDKRGFTLIEMMVAVAIAGLLIAATVPGFLRFRSTLLRNQVRWALIADLRYARQLAVTKHRSVVVAFGNGSTTTDVTTYTLHTDLNSNRVKDTGEAVLSRALPKGSYLTNILLAPPDSVIFDSSGSLWPGTTGGRITFRGPKGISDTLMVSAIGMVYHP